MLPSVVSIQVDGPQGSATGSGFVLRGDGYLITNNHVIAQAKEAASTTITVTFVDGSEQAATIVGSTSDYDLAVLKVDVEGLDAARCSGTRTRSSSGTPSSPSVRPSGSPAP